MLIALSRVLRISLSSLHPPRTKCRSVVRWSSNQSFHLFLMDHVATQTLTSQCKCHRTWKLTCNSTATTPRSGVQFLLGALHMPAGFITTWCLLASVTNCMGKRMRDFRCAEEGLGNLEAAREAAAMVGLRPHLGGNHDAVMVDLLGRGWYDVLL